MISIPATAASAETLEVIIIALIELEILTELLRA